MATIGASMIGLLAAANIPAIGGTTPRIGRDLAGDNANYPFMTFTDPLSSVPVLSGSGKTMARNRRTQWDLWQLVANEDYTLVPLIIAAFDGKQFTGAWDDLGAAAKVFRLRVSDWHRQPEPNVKLVHHVFDVMVTHSA